jgi:hypothetical protein
VRAVQALSIGREPVISLWLSLPFWGSSHLQVLLAHNEEAELVVFGTGGSETAQGIKEGEYTLNFMFSNFQRADLHPPSAVLRQPLTWARGPPRGAA